MNDLFDFFFDKEFYNFHRLVRDTYPYQIEKKEGKTIITHNVLGLGTEDIKIDFVPIDERYSYLVIKGRSPDEQYSVNSRFKVKHSDIEDVEKSIINGILKLEINWKQVKKPEIKIIDKP